MSGVYGLVCCTSGKWYIGSSLNPLQRIASHFKLLSRGRHHNPHLQAAFWLYGPTAFAWCVLQHCPPAERIAAERHWLKNLAAEGYNIRDPSLVSVPPETRAKISASMRGKNTWTKGTKLSRARATALIAARKRAVLTPESVQRYHLSKLGSRNPNFRLDSCVIKAVFSLHGAGLPFRKIGAQLGMSASHASNIYHNRRRQYV